MLRHQQDSIGITSDLRLLNLVKNQLLHSREIKYKNSIFIFAIGMNGIK